MTGNNFHPRSIGGDRTGHRVLGLCLRHVFGRHDNLLIHEWRAGHRGFRPPNHDAVGAAFDNVGIEVRIGLIMGLFSAISLSVGHAERTGQVLTPTGG